MSLPSPHYVLERVTPGLGGCWIWTASRVKGYGQLHHTKAEPPKKAHRVSFELFVGPIPEGYQIHHRCRTTACVRPDHLEAVCPSEHPGAASTLNRLKTRCPKGHPYDYIRPSDGARMCRRCGKEREVRRREEINARRRERWAANADQINRRRRERYMARKEEVA